MSLQDRFKRFQANRERMRTPERAVPSGNVEQTMRETGEARQAHLAEERGRMVADHAKRDVARNRAAQEAGEGNIAA